MAGSETCAVCSWARAPPRRAPEDGGSPARGPAVAVAEAPVDGDLQVGRVEDNERRVTPHLQGKLLGRGGALPEGMDDIL